VWLVFTETKSFFLENFLIIDEQSITLVSYSLFLKRDGAVLVQSLLVTKPHDARPNFSPSL
tara:strand:- start:2 stop:184 length:183 start_codon:yes stop_codon:yes gene_type:complete